jgi:hypothetical protein
LKMPAVAIAKLFSCTPESSEKKILQE